MILPCELHCNFFPDDGVLDVSGDMYKGSLRGGWRGIYNWINVADGQFLTRMKTIVVTIWGLSKKNS